MAINALISKLVTQPQQASAEQLAQITRHIAAAPFTADLLEVDEQGDVIAPGYHLPAVELALLRAIRLDRSWLEHTTVSQFLADLHRAALDPRAGIWTLNLIGEPCLIFAAPVPDSKSKIEPRKLVTVGWYCASTGRLHAGYRTPAGDLHPGEAVEQRPLEIESATPSQASLPTKPQNLPDEPGDWPAQLSAESSLISTERLASRLDAAIQHLRRGS